MPRGTPNNGFRLTARRKALGLVTPESILTNTPIVHIFSTPVAESTESDDEIETRLRERFDILGQLANAAVSGDARALIVSGPAGLGKSYTVEETLKVRDPNKDFHTIVKGYVKPPSLFKLLHQHKEAGQVLVFDDADSIFFDDTSLNFLKAVCDTTDIRTVSYMSEYEIFDEKNACVVPKTFDFHGTIIFITNLDFDTLIEKGHKLTEHLKALVSRSHYVDLAMKNQRDYMVRIKQVVREGLLRKSNLTTDQEQLVMSFVVKNQNKLREHSLRIVLKIAALARTTNNWENVALITCCKQK